MPSPIKRARRARTALLLQKPDTITVIAQRVSAGDTLVAITREWDVPYNLVASWIEADELRKEQYAKAVAVREENHRDRVRASLAEMIDVDISEAFNPDGSLKPIREIPEPVRRAISGLELQEIWQGSGEERRQVGVVKKIKFHDKIRALEIMARSLKMLVDKQEVSIGLSLGDLLEASRRRQAPQPIALTAELIPAEGGKE
jgi:hypothetical protein